MARIETWAVISTGDGLALRRRGQADKPLPGSSLFTLGVTEPVAANSGAGVIRPYPTVVIDGNVTVQTGQTLADRIINGRVTILGTGVLENCVVRGPAAEPTASQVLVSCASSTAAVVRFCDVEPQTPSAYWTGIGSKNYTAYRNKIIGCVDGFAAYATSGTDGLCNIKIQGNYSPNMAHFAPDYANANRTRTHNDFVQMQGNTGTPADILIEGNSANARHHPTYGTQPTVYSELSCLMVSPNTQTKVSYTSRKNWWRGGVFTVNAGDANPGGAIVHDGDRFERPGTVTPGPTSSLVVDAGTTLTIPNPCTYIDNGTTVPVTNG